MYKDRASPEQQGSYTLLVGYARVTPPCAVRTRLFRLINTRNRLLRAPQARGSFTTPLGEINNILYVKGKSHCGKNIRESVTASLLVKLFNNATAGRTVNLIVS
jgi:hypothetical protein